MLGVRRDRVLSSAEIAEETAVSFVDHLVGDEVPVRVFLRLYWNPSDPEVYRLEISGEVVLVRVEEGDRVWSAMEQLARGEVPDLGIDPGSEAGRNGSSPPLLDPWGAIDSVPDGWDS